MSKVVKVTIFVSSMDHYAGVNDGYGKVFTHDTKPVSFHLKISGLSGLSADAMTKQCRTCVGVAQLPLDAEVEIELIASLE